MSISDEINRGYKSYKPKNVNQYTIEDAAKEIFKRNSDALIVLAQKGLVKTSKGLLTSKKYVESWERVSIENPENYKYKSTNSKPGHPVKTAIDDEFSGWMAYNKKDITSLLRILQQLGAKEGIEVSYVEFVSRGNDGYRFVCYIK